MAKVIWTEPALNDLREIIDYIAHDSLIYAERVGIRIVEAPRRLQEFPESGRIVPEFQDDSIRELIYGSYRILPNPKKNLLCSCCDPCESRYSTSLHLRQLGRYLIQ